MENKKFNFENDFIEFDGNLISKNKVVSVGRIKEISTGSLHCDWDYGFEIKMLNGKITILAPTNTDLSGNHYLNRDQRIDFANKKRYDFINLLK